MEIRTVSLGRIPLSLALLFFAPPSLPAAAQSMGWEGQTGGVFSPTAHLVESSAGSLGRPILSFHVLDAGEVLGIHFQTSITLGYGNRMEVGVTRSSVASVGDEPVASLFDRGFTALHAKVRLWGVNDLSAGSASISAGGIFRWQQEHIAADIIPSDPTQNGDLYLVASKILPLSDDVALLISGGGRATNAVFFGIAGNTPSWEMGAFASGGVLFADRIQVGGEWIQQPTHLDGYPEAEIPSTLALFARGFLGSSGRLGLDLALVRVAGVIQSGLDLKAKNQLMVGASFRF